MKLKLPDNFVTNHAILYTLGGLNFGFVLNMFLLHGIELPYIYGCVGVAVGITLGIYMIMFYLWMRNKAFGVVVFEIEAIKKPDLPREVDRVETEI